MTSKLIMEVIMQVVGGLGIFLVGMKYMSEGMQAVAGSRLRKMISAATDNRVLACLVGTGITCLIQSSSVTTVMVVGFVNGGFMTLTQAIGVILGANIGTTITGWILVLKIGKFGLPILGVSALFHLFAKSEKLRYTALCIMGIGMVFFGLQIMSKALKHEEVEVALKTAFAALSGGTFLSTLKCAAVGCLATFIVQSSSATLGVTIALALSGVIDFQTAAGLIMGLNIGTTVTAFLASLGTTTNAKRAAYAHICFNILGTLWLLPLFGFYTGAIEQIVDWVQTHSPAHVESAIGAKIALAHTGFNVINTIVFLPLLGFLARAVTWMVPEKQGEEIPHLTYLDIRMIETPAFGIQQSQIEVSKMGEQVLTMSNILGESLAQEKPEPEGVKRLFHREEILDDVQREVTVFLSEMLSGSVTHEVMDSAREQLRISDELESVGDYYAMVMKRLLKLTDEGIILRDVALTDLQAIHKRVDEYVRMITHAVEEDFADILSKAVSESSEISHMVKQARQRHLERISTNPDISPFKSLAYTDMLQAYRKIKDHMLNVAEALAGAK